jgi:type 1 glutamine amidotransferase
MFLTSALAAGDEPPAPGRRGRVLVFTKTAGFRHDSIPDAIAAVRAIGAADGFAVDATEDASRFDDATLATYDAVVFLSTTGDVLDDTQESVLQRYIHSGGGFAGVHAAADTEHGWPWYLSLVGAEFRTHPAIQRAVLRVADPAHASTRGLPAAWTRTDEWYDFVESPRGTVQVLLTLDETTYAGGGMGADHPIAWCRWLEGGRTWYTALGHTRESWSEPLFLDHVRGGIRFAAGYPDCPGRGTRTLAPRAD